MRTRGMIQGAAVGLFVWHLAASVCAAELARPSDAFVDTLGINTHSAFPGNSFDQDWNRVIQAVGDIGFRYVRDLPDRADRLNALSDVTGAKICAIAQNYIGANSMTDLPAVVARLKSLNNLAYIEWPNEPPFIGVADWQTALNTWVPALWNAAKSDSYLSTKPVVATTHILAADFPGIGQYADLGNMHVYPGGALPLSRFTNTKLESQAITGNKPLLATETGYITLPSFAPWEYNYGVTEAAAAKYLPRLLLDFYNEGVIRTMPYELMDERADPDNIVTDFHLGLLRADFTWKPAAHSIKNLIALLADPGTEFTPASLEFTLTGGGPNLRHTLLQKRDGTFWLALWQDVLVYDWQTKSDLAVADIAVTLGLGSEVLAARTYLPGQSTDAAALFQNASSLNLSVPAEVMLVQLDFTGVTVPEPAGALLLLALPLLARRGRR